jgi:hypothetical protein
MYPRLPSGRAVYQLKVILFSVTVGLLLSSVIVVLMVVIQSRVGK